MPLTTTLPSSLYLCLPTPSSTCLWVILPDYSRFSSCSFHTLLSQYFLITRFSIMHKYLNRKPNPQSHLLCPIPQLLFTAKRNRFVTIYLYNQICIPTVYRNCCVQTYLDTAFFLKHFLHLACRTSLFCFSSYLWLLLLFPLLVFLYLKCLMPSLWIFFLS